MIQPIIFDYVGATVQPLDDRFHDLIAKEQAGTITEAETTELDALCHAKEGGSVLPIPVAHLEFLMEGKR